MLNMIETLGKVGVVPVIVIEDIEKAVPLAQALVKGGLNVLEVTFRTPCAAEAIFKIKQEVPGVTVVAGTVLGVDQLLDAQAAGAEACIAPGFDPVVVAKAKDFGMRFCPGIATAGELNQAIRMGCKLVKFFPAESAGGVKYVKDLLGAFRWTGVKFMPTGGVKPANLGDYLAVPEIVACGGTWIAPKDAVAANDFARIEQLAAEAVELVRKAR